MSDNQRKQMKYRLKNYDITAHIGDVFDAYLLREDFGSEYILKESGAFRKKIVEIFDGNDAI